MPPSFSLLSRFIFSRSFSARRKTSARIPKSIAKIILDEKDLTTLVKNFKQQSESSQELRNSGHGLYLNVIRRLAKNGEFGLVEDMLEFQKKFDDIKKENFAAKIIELYGFAGMADHARKTFDQLPELQCDRTQRSVRALLKAYVDASKYEQVEPLYNEIRAKLNLENDIWTSNILIKSFVKMGDFDSVLRILDELEKPPVVIYSTILGGLYSKVEMFSKGEDIWVKMEREGLQPDIKCYNYKLMGIRLSKGMSEAIQYVEEMEKSTGVKPDPVTYHQLIIGYCNEGNLDEAKKVYDDKLEKGLMSWQSAKILFPCLIANGELDKSFEMCCQGFEKIKGSIDMTPTQVVVEALVKESRLEDAKKLVEITKGKSHTELSLEVPTSV